MEQDHYSVLGVTPASGQAAIRAAYLALMRRHHPDAAPGSADAEQARAINQAYSVLGDPQKRARYDGSIASMRALRFEPMAAEHAPAKGSRIGPAAAIGVALLAAGMVAFAIMPPTRPVSFPFAFRGEQTPVRAPAKAPVHAADPLANQMVGSTAVTPSLAVSELAPSDRVLPTVKPAELDPSPAKPAARSMPAPGPTIVPASASTLPSAQLQPAPTQPSCAWASRATDKLVCGDANLSSLDRQLLLLYRQSWRQADETKRAELLRTRQQFNDRREACSSSNCLTTAYVSRLKEISDIMAGRFQP